MHFTETLIFAVCLNKIIQQGISDIPEKKLFSLENILKTY